MANLRVFVSSTYYDLHHVRNDLYTFIKGRGYEPVMHDKGGIPYTQEKTLEEQKEFYNNVWNTKRWRGMFNIFFSNKVNSC